MQIPMRLNECKRGSSLFVYEHELTDSKSIEASHVLFGCKLDLVGQVFDIDLLPNTLVSSDMILVIYVSSREFSAKRKSCVPSPQWGILISLRSSWWCRCWHCHRPCSF
ncbi:hypothetical protein HanXRQr2_Chr01g0024301 [Helianthus annuus]|uniref:Uncharacterized protein n=1 Tax=Helianthus annuus TaxID=4232 RepID=A0A9K3JV22_HELAN|nr:hypothetical protein HanXRQr2_Chr01g0024301 [Helianthus annuus]KAJ0951506.1 hypothetical protein HanPSC8_Chr02g0060861 [Helianthus annuus]